MSRNIKRSDNRNLWCKHDCLMNNFKFNIIHNFYKVVSNYSGMQCSPFGDLRRTIVHVYYTSRLIYTFTLTVYFLYPKFRCPCGTYFVLRETAQKHCSFGIHANVLVLLKSEWDSLVPLRFNTSLYRNPETRNVWARTNQLFRWCKSTHVVRDLIRPSSLTKVGSGFTLKPDLVGDIEYSTCSSCILRLLGLNLNQTLSAFSPQNIIKPQNIISTFYRLL